MRDPLTPNMNTKDNNVYSLDGNGDRSDHETVEDAIANCKTMYDGIVSDSQDDPNFLLGAVYANGKEDPVFEWYIKDQDAKEELEEKVGKGIDGVISQEDIISAIGNCDIDFFYNILHAEWNPRPRIPGSHNVADATVELRKADLKQYGKDWTITDHIRAKMNAHEAGFQTSEVEI